MSHPVKFVDYACGHSSPIKGGSHITAAGPCAACQQPLVPAPAPHAPFSDDDRANLARILGTRPRRAACGHPFERHTDEMWGRYCSDCDAWCGDKCRIGDPVFALEESPNA